MLADFTCENRGGRPGQFGEHCLIGNPCAPAVAPVMACCLPDGTCTDLTEQECSNLGGQSAPTGDKCVDQNEFGEQVIWDCSPPEGCFSKRFPGPKRWTAKLCDDVSFAINPFTGDAESDIEGAKSRHHVRAEAGVPGERLCKTIGGRLMMDDDGFVRLGYCSNPRSGGTVFKQLHRAELATDREGQFGTNKGDHVFVGTIHTPFWFETEVTSIEFVCGRQL